MSISAEATNAYNISFDEAYKKADDALYYTKEYGRKNVAMYSKDLNK